MRFFIEESKMLQDGIEQGMKTFETEAWLNCWKKQSRGNIFNEVCVLNEDEKIITPKRGLKRIEKKENLQKGLKQYERFKFRRICRPIKTEDWWRSSHGEIIKNRIDCDRRPGWVIWWKNYSIMANMIWKENF